MAETNPHATGKGNSDGEIVFGKVMDNDEITACFLNNRQDKLSDHYIAMYETGPEHLEGGTVIHSSGGTYIRAGTGIESRDDIGDNIPAVIIEADTNDVILAAPNGKIRIIAQGIELVAEGYDNTTGNIILSANEKIIMSGESILGKAPGDISFTCEGTMNLIGKSTLNMYSALKDNTDSSQSIINTIAQALRGSLTLTDFAKTLGKKLFFQN